MLQGVVSASLVSLVAIAAMLMVRCARLFVLFCALNRSLNRWSAVWKAKEGVPANERHCVLCLSPGREHDTGDGDGAKLAMDFQGPD